MANMSPKRIQRDDEENTGFGLPAKVADHKSGFDRSVAKKEAETGKNRRRRPSEEKDIPRESLATRVARHRKEG